MPRKIVKKIVGLLPCAGAGLGTKSFYFGAKAFGTAAFAAVSFGMA
jgi:hypothetical protein